MALKMTRKKWAILVIAIALILAKIATVFRPGFPITISKETTYITEPLRPDGFPDYMAALNQRASEGVTPENNFTTLFWQAVGPDDIRPEYREEYFRLLGIPAPPEQGDYFITDAEHEKRLLDHRIKQTNKDDKLSDEEISKKHWDDFDTIITRHWSRDEFPGWAEWIDANRKPLNMLAEAAKRPRNYNPLVGGNRVIDALVTGAESSRDVARAFIARAMLRLHEGKTEEAWEDILTCHQIGRLIGRGSTLIDALVSFRLDHMACEADAALLESGEIDRGKITEMRGQLTKLPKLPSMVEKLGLMGRFLCLDAVVCMARDGLDAIDGNNNKQRGPIDSLVNSSSIASIDWDLMLRMQNEHYDRLVEACCKPTRAERTGAIRLFDEELNQEIESSRSWKKLSSYIFDTRKARSKAIGLVLKGLLTASASAVMEQSDRSKMRIDLTELAFALSEYRAENGTFPEKLAELTPKYVKSVPKDIFNKEADLHYLKDGDGFLLYSVGPNGTNDGGNTYDDCRAGESWDDISVRIKKDKSGE